MLAETARAELGLYSPNDVIISIDLSKLKFSDILPDTGIN
jgi:cell division protein FtsB